MKFIDYKICNNDISNLNDILNIDGALIINNFLDDKKLSILKNEFRDISQIYSKSPGFIKSKGTSMASILLDNENKKSFFKKYQVLENAILESQKILKFNNSFKDSILFIYVHQDNHKININTRWHSDPTDIVKFFITLDDATERNGVTDISLGSHNDSLYRYKYRDSSLFWKRLMSDGTIFRREELVFNKSSSSRNKGDLLIFRTGTFHKAGKIDQNLSRMCIRWWWEPIPKNIFSIYLFSKIKYYLKRFLSIFLKEFEFYL